MLKSNFYFRSSGPQPKACVIWQGDAVNQDVDLPGPIMEYLLKNPPSWEFYQKIIKVCKMFYMVNPILVADRFTNGMLGINNDDGRIATIRMDQGTAKIWLTGSLHLTTVSRYGREIVSDWDVIQIFAKLSERLFRCETDTVSLKTRRDVEFEKFRVCLSAKYISIDAPLVNPDGSLTRLEEILGATSNVEVFEIDCRNSIVDETTADGLIKLENIAALKCLRLDYMSFKIDFDGLFRFLLKHRVGKNFKRTTIRFASLSDDFYNRALSDDFHDQMNTLVAKIGMIDGLRCEIDWEDRESYKEHIYGVSSDDDYDTEFESEVESDLE